jgi:hypothetical protein
MVKNSSASRGIVPAWFTFMVTFAYMMFSCSGKVASVVSGAMATTRIQFVSSTLQGITVGDVATAIPVAGGTPPLKFSINTGQFPDGLSMDEATGLVTGRIGVTQADKNYVVGITVTDSVGTTATATFTGKVDPGDSQLKILNNAINSFTATISYNYPLIVAGGFPPYTFSLKSGSFPSGVNLDPSTGVISGTPTSTTSGQSFAAVVNVTDQMGQVVTKPFGGVVSSNGSTTFAITSTSIPQPIPGATYGAAIGISGGTGPYNFTITSGSLPSGLTLNASTGAITGSLALSAQGASWVFTLQCADSLSQTATMIFSGSNGTYSTSIFPAGFPGGQPEAVYNASVATINGATPYTYAITSGTLPSGLSLDTSTGVVSGVIAKNESGITRTFTIRSTDANGMIASQSYSITTSAFVVSVATASLSNAVEGVAYTNSSTNLAATGGTGPYTFEWSGSLPSGVGLTSLGVFFGTPSQGSGAIGAGTTYTVNIRARDSLGQVSATSTFTIVVTVSAPVIDALTPSTGIAAQNYSYTITASGGRAPYTFGITSGAFASGLSMSGSGVISGIPAATSACPGGQANVVVTDALGQLSSAVSKCVEVITGVTINNGVIPVAVNGTPYSLTIQSSGGTSPYTFGAVGLPTGLTLNSSTGVISGTPAETAGDYTVYLSATDSAATAQNVGRAIVIKVRDSVTLATATLPLAATGFPYNSGSGAQLSASGGDDAVNTTAFTYTITAGALPSGLTMSSAGLISGTPGKKTAANGGSYTVTVVATDALGLTSSAVSYSMSVVVGPKLTDTTLPPALLNRPYSYDLQRLGGMNQFNGASTATRLTWAMTGLTGTGLSFDTATGRIYGTPTSNAGSPYTLNVQVTDQNNFTASKSVTLQINSAGKVLDLKTARISDPCTGGATNCSPTTFGVSAIVNGNVQQYMIYPRNDLSPRQIQIAKIDEFGRIPRADANVTSVKFVLPANVASVSRVQIADVDQDNFKDIAFTDQAGRLYCVAYNAGTIDVNGMPNGFSAANTQCFPIHAGVSTGGAFGLKIANDLRPDATNYGKMDALLTSTNNTITTVYFLKNNCAQNGACNNATGQRPVQYEGFIPIQASITNTSPNVTVADTKSVAVGAPISGVGIPSGTRVASITNATTFVMTANASVTNAAASLVIQAATRNITGVLTSGSATVTGSDTTLLAANQFIVGPGIPSGTRVSSITNATTFVMTAAATASATSKITVALGQAVSATTTNTSGTVTTASTANLIVGQMIAGTNIPAGTYIVSVTNATTFTISQGATGTGATTIYPFGPNAHTPVITAVSSYMRDNYEIDYGWFIDPRPNLPGTLATSQHECPGFIVSGFQQNNTGNGYIYLARQNYSGGQCQGDFTIHTSTDELYGFGGTPWMSGLVAADFTNDGLTDLAAGSERGQTSGASIKFFTPSGGTSIFTNGFTTVPMVQSRGTAYGSIARLASYCLDGSSSCTYPSLIATCGRGPGATASDGCFTILPNQCSAPGCTTPFESTVPYNRMDYPAPSGTYGRLITAPVASTSYLTPTGTTTNGSNVITSLSSVAGLQVGQTVTGTNIAAFSYITAVGAGTITINNNASGSASGVTLTIPEIPTRNDILMSGLDVNSMPFLLTYARNGASTTDPVKGSGMLDGFPAMYLQTGDIGTMRLADANSDGNKDLFAYSPSNTFLNSYMSSSSGGVNYGVHITLDASYLSNPTENGCPSGSTSCFPDPIMNVMGVQQGYPAVSGYMTQNIMDIGDIDNDDIPDAVVVGNVSHGVAVSLGNTTGDFAAPKLYDFANSRDIRPTSVTFADLDQDGFLDIALIGQDLTGGTAGMAGWFKGKGDGTFNTAQTITQIVNGCTDPRQISAVDIDMDGRPELAVLCYTSQAVWISRRHTDGTWVLQSGATINTNAGANGISMKWGRLTTGTQYGKDLVIAGLDLTKSMTIINNVRISSINGSNQPVMSAPTVTNKQLFGYASEVDIADLDADGYGDAIIGMNRSSYTGANWGGHTYTCASTGTGTCNALAWGFEADIVKIGRAVV